MRIYIVRHGDTDLNKKRVLQGQYDEKLNEKGIFLAKISGQNLKGIHFDEAFSSPLSRSIETVKCILEESNNYDVPIHIDNRLIEIDLGDWTLKELDNKDLEDYKTINSFFHNPFSVTKCKNGESIYDVISRTQEFIKELIVFFNSSASFCNSIFSRPAKLPNFIFTIAAACVSVKL